MVSGAMGVRAGLAPRSVGRAIVPGNYPRVPKEDIPMRIARALVLPVLALGVVLAAPLNVHADLAYDENASVYPFDEPRG